MNCPLRVGVLDNYVPVHLRLGCLDDGDVVIERIEQYVHQFLSFLVGPGHTVLIGPRDVSLGQEEGPLLAHIVIACDDRAKLSSCRGHSVYKHGKSLALVYLIFDCLVTDGRDCR